MTDRPRATYATESHPDVKDGKERQRYIDRGVIKPPRIRIASDDQPFNRYATRH